MTTLLDQGEAHFQQGVAQARNRDFEAAAESFRRSAEAVPEHSFTHNNLGSALAMLGQHEEAIHAFRRALEIDPDYAQALVNLGISLQAVGRHEEAEACFVKAIAIDPQQDAAYFHLGQAHYRARRPHEAVACYLRSIELNPEDPDAYAELGTVLLSMGHVDHALQAFEKALSMDPDIAAARAHLIYRLACDCEWDRLAIHLPLVPELGVAGSPVPPFTLLAFEDHPGRHRIRSEKFATDTYAAVRPFPARPRPAARPERLRIGYFSADFREHAVLFLSIRLFELHDRERFSIHAYAYGRSEDGPTRNRAVAAFDTFKDVRDLGHQAIAEMARADGIDIAVDLTGYTQQQRVGLFAYRPAPIQMTFLGYPGTLGAPFIDYLVADRTVVPDEQRHGYSERLIYLPDSYQINDDTRSTTAPGTRAEEGLPAEGFVFCCFNAAFKITPVEFGIWMDLLKRVDDSVLWLLGGSRVERNLRAECAKQGVDPNRLVFAPKVDPARHLARQGLADLFIDTFNYNAHTTASDALWAGVPVVTKAGDGFAARVASSLLHAIGLGELVTTNERDYAALALDLATDPARLGAIRARLREYRTSMPLFDSAAFTGHLEQAFDLAYGRYLEGEEPADITVPRQ